MIENSEIETLNLARNFNLLREEEKSKIPYQLNLLDEVGSGVNENAHSRILLKILSYKNNNSFPFFEIFLQCLNSNFQNIKISNPIFSSEKDRIDVLISDRKGGYSIIIENKINNAPDQPNQIKRYVNIQKSKGFKEENIIVLYLTASGSKSPEEKSLPNNLKLKLSQNYQEINFKEHIIRWLILCVKSEVVSKNELIQYLDHLEGKFDMRIQELEMKEKLSKLLFLEIKLSDSIEDSISILSKERNNLNIVDNYLIEKQNVLFSKLYLDWKNKLESKKYDVLTNLIDYKNAPNYIYLGRKVKVNGEDAVCAIGLDSISSEPYYGLTIRGVSNDKNENIVEYIKKSKVDFEGYKSSPRWYQYRISSLENVFKKYEQFLETILKLQ